jgi:ATP-dependent helicase/nuclease subunit A
MVVTAGAGTGKTALLVERILDRLLDPRQPVSPESLVAITFTKKAAGEMRDRIRRALLGFHALSRGVPPAEPDPLLDEMYERALARHPKELPAEVMGERVLACLRELERAFVSTIHAFAARILRLHPTEAGIAPGFTEDEGEGFEDLFDSAWVRWVRGEWGSGDREAWLSLLSTTSLTDLEELAKALCRERHDLDTLGRALGDPEPLRAPREWLEEMAREAEDLSETYAGGTRKIERQVEAALRVLREEANGGDVGLLEGSVSGVKGWTEEDEARAKIVIRTACGLARADNERFVRVLRLLLPFALRFRRSYSEAGWISFDGLLVRARDLLASRPEIRESLKKSFRLILVDEFQDTDPLQYEIVTFLAEEPGGKAIRWQDVRLEPGKLFIVGDPKQSIYGFRGADIRAYHEVTRHLARDPAHLTVNFRSDVSFLRCVNAIFERIIREREKVQPAYEDLLPRPLAPEGGEAPIEFRWVGDPADPKLADPGAEDEAAELARWIRDEVIEQERPPGDVAVLVRTRTRLDVIVEAFRQAGIRAVVEGQRSFYTTSEITGVLNLVRSIAFPEDPVALAGVLRGPLGGLTDRELLVLMERGRLDYRRDPDPAALEGVAHPEVLRELLATLRLLSDLAAAGPAIEAVEALFEELPLLEVAAVSDGGDQAYGNVNKVRRLLCEWSLRPGMTFADLAGRLARSVDELVEEGESPLAEEDPGAVRILTMHKAKGLEFPIVLVPGINSGSVATPPQVDLQIDWTTGLIGGRLPGVGTESAVYLERDRRTREESEIRRLLYVAATRARERVVFFSPVPGRRSRGESHLHVLREALGSDLGPGGPESLEVGSVAVRQVTVPAPESPRSAEARSERKRRRPPGNLVRTWRERAELLRAADSRRLRLVPSALEEEDASRIPEGAGAQSGERSTALRVGSLVHVALEILDLSRGAGDLDRSLEAAARVLDEGAETVRGEAAAILAGYLASEAAREVARSELLGREVPFLMGDEERDAAVEGAIDLVYRSPEGVLVVADYKTDHVATPGEARAAAARYRAQARCYVEAVGRALGEPVSRFELHFVRPGVRIDLAPVDLENG